MQDLAKQESVLSPRAIQKGGSAYSRGVAYWQEMMRSGVLPKHVRSPQVAMVMAEIGELYGWTPIQSVNNLTVIEGTVSMKAATMLGLIQEYCKQTPGASVRQVERSLDRVVYAVRRRDVYGDDEPVYYSFSQEEAKIAGLWGRKSSGGKPLPWACYPIAMMNWRAVSVMAREGFSDIFTSVRHSAEELEDAATVTQLEAEDRPVVSTLDDLATPEPEGEMPFEGDGEDLPPEIAEPMPWPEEVRIVVRRGENEYETTGWPPIIFGRSDKCKIRLKDEALGDEHASIVLEQGVLRIINLGAGPVALNGEEIAAADLSHGDTIGLGEYDVSVYDHHFVEEEQPEQPEPEDE